MNAKAFQKLLDRYIQGQCTEQEIRQVHQWFDNLNQEPPHRISSEERKEMNDRLLNRIYQQMDEPVSTRPLRTRQPWIVPLGVAASVALLLMIAWYSWTFGFPTNFAQKEISVAEQETDLVHYTNRSNYTQKISLEDQSTVLVSPGGSIAYPRHFRGNRREVQLQGDAFFQVSKNPKRPFLVYCGNTVTQVLGTSFWVKSQDKSKVVEVEVRSGKVSVYEKSSATHTSTQSVTGPQANGVVLTPNQKVTYFSEKHHLISGLVEKPTLIVPTESAAQWVFTDTPLVKVLQELEKGYGIEFIAANDQLAACTFTGDLSELPLYEKLHLICNSTKTSFEVRGTHILISGNAGK